MSKEKFDANYIEENAKKILDALELEKTEEGREMAEKPKPSGEERTEKGKSAEELTAKEMLEQLMYDLILYVEDTDMKGFKNADLFKDIQAGNLHSISTILEERASQGDERAKELMERVDAEKFKSSSTEDNKEEYAEIAQKEYEKWRAERMG